MTTVQSLVKKLIFEIYTADRKATTKYKVSAHNYATFAQIFSLHGFHDSTTIREGSWTPLGATMLFACIHYMHHHLLLLMVHSITVMLDTYII